MSIAPDGIIPAPVLPASGPKGAPYSVDDTIDPLPPKVRDITRVRLTPGDRLLVTVDGALGLGPAGAYEMGKQIRDGLHLDELGFDVPFVVLAPGMRVEVLHP